MPAWQFWGGKLTADIHRWKQIKGLSQKGDVYALVFLLMVYPELRSVFYWRIGKLAKFFFFWMPGRANLHLVTNPNNVGGGFYVGHGWGTVVNAKRIGENFRDHAWRQQPSGSWCCCRKVDTK